MGRFVLLTAGRAGRAGLFLAALSALAAAGCAEPALQRTARADGDPHADVSCSTCHDGPLAQVGEAAVPAQACTASGCHTDGGPREVKLSSVEFQHRGHGGDSTIVATACAGCHTHDAGNEPLVANVDACSLCHLNQQATGGGGECRTCHQAPSHVGFTSQGVEVPHQGLPWVEGGCVRCHYDVTRPPVEVSVTRCSSCHTDLDAAVAGGIGEDLHQTHTGSACTACHDGGTHRIQAMTSSVDLQCTDCHAREHDLELAADFPDPATCDACHGSAHQAEQRMVLGLVPDLPGPAPSEKFMDGLTCRSCHGTPGDTDPATLVQSVSQDCVGCHRPEYATVLRWWRQGSSDRLGRTDQFVSTARRRLGNASDTVAGELAAATRMVDLVRDGGAVHNLPLAHELLTEATQRVSEAYRLAGVDTPAPPNLGPQPRMGLCSYCHYRPNDPWLYEEMSGSFHRDVLRIGG